ncbi:hypothetical protein BC830DRAFT_1207869, partial [Chytriomyces sp. MP71]
CVGIVECGCSNPRDVATSTVSVASTTATTSAFSPASTATIPSDSTLIQSTSYKIGKYDACWEVAPDKSVVVAICDQSNLRQWWKVYFGQLVNVDNSGNPQCVGVADKLDGTLLTASSCGTGTGQFFFFNPSSNNIRPAVSYTCLTVNSSNGTINQKSCSNTADQQFIASKQDIFFPSFSTTSCSSYTFRKEWRDMTTQDRQAFIDAMDAVRAMPSVVGRRSYFDDLVAVHATFLNFVHGNHLFWPWHRAYITIFEQALQKSNPEVTLPYWDWALDGDAPFQNTDIFGSNISQYGTRGNPTESYPTCISDGFAKSWTSMYGQCTSRNYTLDAVVYDDSYMIPLVLNSTDFGSFANAAETAHAVVHAYIGGLQGDLYYIDLSTNDPLFFLHHANVGWL